MYIPTVGSNVPRTWGFLARAIGRMLLRMCRWHIEGEICDEPKFVLVMAPHTSWWDFTNNLGVMLSTGIDVSWFIANKYTWWPVGGIIRSMGGVPVERSSRHDLVTQMVNHITNSSQFVLAISPEGTRKKVLTWKTGFWYIAKQSKIPVQLISFNYDKRATVFGPVLELSDDIEVDLKRVQEYYRGAAAMYPEKFGGDFL